MSRTLMHTATTSAAAHECFRCAAAMHIPSTSCIMPWHALLIAAPKLRMQSTADATLCCASRQVAAANVADT